MVENWFCNVFAPIGLLANYGIVFQWSTCDVFYLKFFSEYPKSSICVPQKFLRKIRSKLVNLILFSKIRLVQICLFIQIKYSIDAKIHNSNLTLLVAAYRN